MRRSGQHLFSSNTGEGANRSPRNPLGGRTSNKSPKASTGNAGGHVTSPVRYWAIMLMAIAVAKSAEAPLVHRSYAGVPKDAVAKASPAPKPLRPPAELPSSPNVPFTLPGGGSGIAQDAPQPDRLKELLRLLQPPPQSQIKLTAPKDEFPNVADYQTGFVFAGNTGGFAFTPPPISSSGTPPFATFITIPPVGVGPPVNRVVVGSPGPTPIPEPTCAAGLFTAMFILSKRRGAR